MPTDGVEYKGRNNKVSYFCTGVLFWCSVEAEPPYISWEVIIKANNVSPFFCKLQHGYYMHFLSQLRCTSKVIRIKI